MLYYQRVAPLGLRINPVLGEKVKAGSSPRESPSNIIRWNRLKDTESKLDAKNEVRNR